MATAFDSIGMGQLGSERRFMTGDNPFSQGLRGVKDFAILSALDKSGIADYLNDLGKSKTPAGGAVPPTGTPAIGINPQAAASWNVQPPSAEFPAQNQNVQPFGGSFFNNANQQQQKSIEDAANEAMNLTKSSSFTTPNEFEKTSQSESQAILAQANQPVAPPGGMNLPQYGQKKGSSIGPVAGAVLSFLPKLFGMA